MKLIPKAVAGHIAKAAIKAKAEKPSLLFYGGIAGMGASTALACRATLQLEPKLKQIESDLDAARNIVPPKGTEYTDEERKKDVVIIYTRGALDITKLYLPSVLLSIGSIAALTSSHRMLKDRNLALMTAYAAVDEAFKSYRARVVERYGIEEDQRLRHAHETVTVIDEETGKKVSRIRVNPDEAPSMYARFFDEYSTEWNKEAEYNFVFLRAQQNYFNDLLRGRGYVMLNEVYKGLGLSQTTAGAVVGWIMDGNGDSYIDFGLFREDESVWDFVNGRERSILLDFNVDGVVYDKLDDFQKERKPWQS